ncbi:TadE/TadG family type IV pilus assembly protein [Microlunatus ginsengisoli]|uniref:TadE-like domain-containing protein n=1 Tax=Microlunatus ginsengisoli TaxID=363863 RepID=A0ABP7AS35_9ACTN
MQPRQSERGAAALEFALVVPVLLVLVLGIAEFGRAFYTQITLSAAAREGVRVMALSTTPATAVANAKSATINAATGLGLTGGQIVVTPGAGCPNPNTAGAQATVTINYSMPFITDMFGPSISLHGKGVMRCNG